MNIALFTDSYTPVKNGVVTSVRQLKEGLESRGHNVIVITADVPYFQDTEQGIYRLPSVPAKLGAGTEFRFSMINQSPINKFLKKRKIDIIHTHSEFSIGFCGKRAAKKLKVPLVHTTHTMWENYTHYLMNGKLITPKMARKYMAMYLKNVTQIVAPSVKAKNYYSQIVPNKPIEIVPNGIDSDKFKSSEIKPDEINQLRKEFGIKKNDINLIFVGRVGQEKRVDELFETVAPILRKYDNLKMIIVGDGPNLHELRAKAEKQGLHKKFIFTGFVNWELVYRLYSMSDIFVTLSLSEVHPMTLIEGAMCGLPIIARYDESCLDLVVEGKSGFLIHEDSELESKVKYYLDNPEELKKAKEASFELSKQFTAEHHVEKIEKLYERVIAEFKK